MDKWLKIGTQSPDNEKNDNTNENNEPTSNKLRKTVNETPNKYESSGIVSTSKNIERNALSNKKLRKYQEGFIKYGFTFCVVNGEERPLRVNCSDKLANESFKPAKLKRHLETKHKEFANKSESFFKRRAELMKNQTEFMKTYTTIPEKALRASLEVSYLIGKNLKPHTIGESLILPSAIKMTSIMHGEKYGNDLKTIPLSRDTVSRRISAISRNIESVLLHRIQNSPVFALQLDETTDITKMSQLIVYVRYVFEEDISEDLLCCKKLEERATGEKIFIIINKYFEENDLAWTRCVAVCTDGAAALTGSNKGLRGLIMKIAPHIVFNHCTIHRQALVAKDIDEELHKILNDVVIVINYIKSNSLNSRLFSILCNEMGSVYETLLLHTEVRWLSRGKILRRIFDLRNEVYIFLVEKKHILARSFINEDWLGKLSYVVDIFEKLNDLNMSLQGEGTNILTLSSKIEAFKNKLILWQGELNKNNADVFPCFSEFTKENNIDSLLFKNIISHHLIKLVENFTKRYEKFPENELGWIRDPFSFDIINSNIPLNEKEQLIDISSDETLRIQFNSLTCQKFWLSIGNEYADLKRKAIDILIQFASTYSCESGFSKLVSIKTKYRSRLDPEDDLRLAISNTDPNIEAIMSSLQAHTSH